MNIQVLKLSVLVLSALHFDLTDSRNTGWDKRKGLIKRAHISCNCSSPDDIEDAREFGGYKLTELIGPIPAVYTPFYDDGEINFSIIPEYVKYLDSIGAHAILVAGTTGEALSLTTCERKQLLEAFANEASKFDMKVAVHIGGVDLPSVVDMARHAQRMNVSAIMSLPSLFNKPKTPQELVDYLHIVSKAAPSTPLLYYHTPDKSGVNVNMRQFFKLATEQIPTFAGMKSGLEAAINVQSLLTSNQKVYISTIQVASSAIIGFDSSMNGAYNVVLKSALEILDAVQSGDVQRAKIQQQNLTRTISEFGDVANFYTSGKAVMEMVTGIKVGPVRPPLVSISSEVRRRIYDIAAENGLPVIYN